MLIFLQEKKVSGILEPEEMDGLGLFKIKKVHFCLSSKVNLQNG